MRTFAELRHQPDGVPREEPPASMKGVGTFLFAAGFVAMLGAFYLQVERGQDTVNLFVVALALIGVGIPWMEGVRWSEVTWDRSTKLLAASVAASLLVPFAAVGLEPVVPSFHVIGALMVLNVVFPFAATLWAVFRMKRKGEGGSVGDWAREAYGGWGLRSFLFTFTLIPQVIGWMTAFDF
jgi:hypothetical protein